MRTERERECVSKERPGRRSRLASPSYRALTPNLANHQHHLSLSPLIMNLKFHSHLPTYIAFKLSPQPVQIHYPTLGPIGVHAHEETTRVRITVLGRVADVEGARGEPARD